MDSPSQSRNPVHSQYRPRNPSEPQSLASSIQVIRQSDNAFFLATRIPSIDSHDVRGEESTASLLSYILPVASKSLLPILNHPNVISLINLTRATDFTGVISEPNEYKDLSVWEDMTAGCLAYLLPNASKYPDFDNEEAWEALAAENFRRFSLPESLCWHVLRSMSRALLWLHRGMKEAEGVIGDFQLGDAKWQTILIRDISPGQIWFQKPKGKETYGLCKLGGFQWAQMCEGVSERVAAVERPEKAQRTQQYYWAPEVYENTIPWTRAAEVWSLGAVIYTMMTGMPPPRFHPYHWQISRMNDRGFSKGLRDVVSNMLKLEPKERPNSARLVAMAEDRWEEWRATTEEGAVYVDADDST